MRTIYQYITLFTGIFFSLFLSVPGVFAQDSLFQAKIQKNIQGLKELYCWNDTDFFTGNFPTDAQLNFEDAVHRLEVFSEPMANARYYYEMYSQLNQKEQKYLVRYFAFYESLFVSELEEIKMATDLKYLAPALSALNPFAVDNDKRAGIWQLNHFQAVLNGLQITKLVDERFNAVKATRAFALQLKSNKVLFHSDELAVLAYLAGKAKMNNVLVRCENKADLSEVLNIMPGEVSDILANFQALSVFLKQHRFIANAPVAVNDTVDINRQVHFKQITSVLGVSEEQLRFLNPQYRHSIVPGNENIQKLVLPIGNYETFEMMSDSVFHISDSSLFEIVTQKIEYAPAPSRQYLGEKVKDLEIEGKTKIRYTIQSGDVLGFIAEDYNVRVADLKYWNNIYNERKIQAGKTLDIFVDDEHASYYKGLQPESERHMKTQVVAIPANARKVEHTVKNGESPYHIAKKYEGVTPEAILSWNGISDARKIQIGQNLIIYLAQ